MKARRVLLEADNLTLPTGTGIATYARNLGRALKDLGYSTGALVGVPRGLSQKDPALNRIGFHDAQAGRSPSFSLRMRLKRSELIGSPFGVRTVRLMDSPVVIDPNPGRFEMFDEVHTAFRLSELARNHFYRHGRAMAVRPDVTPDVFHATQAMPIRVRGAANVYTIHDLIPLRLPYTTLDNKKYALDVHRHLAQTADHVVTVSEHSKRDIVELLGIPEDRVTNTYQAVEIPRRLLDRPFDEVAEDLLSLYGLKPRDYFLFVGAIEPKKNVGRLVDAFASSGSRRKLIIAGNPAWMADDDLRKIDDERFFQHVMHERRITPTRRVRRLSYVPFDHLVSLIRGARGLIFPSIYEGFGLPVLEAMLLGTPVITSDVSSLPEIAGDAAMLVSPYDTIALSRAIRTLDADDDLAAELARRGTVQAGRFGREAYVERLAALYRRLT